LADGCTKGILAEETGNYNMCKLSLIDIFCIILSKVIKFYPAVSIT